MGEIFPPKFRYAEFEQMKRDLKDMVKRIEAMKAEKTCPSCGHCPTCGRSRAYPYWPYYHPLPFYHPLPYYGTGTTTSNPGSITWTTSATG